MEAPSHQFANLTTEQQDDCIDVTLRLTMRVLLFMCPTTLNVRQPVRPGGHTDVWLTVKTSLDRGELPPLDALERVGLWARTELYWRGRRARGLTPEERDVKVAVERVLAAIQLARSA